jgi:polyhydroxyalkanoate synthesis regulator phasin
LIAWLTNNKDLITSVAAIVTSIGVVFVAIQARLAAKQFKSDHERSRRETAIRVIKDWNDSLNMTTPSARRFVQELSKEQCKNMIKLEQIKVNEKHQNLLAYALNDTSPEIAKLTINNSEIILNTKQISHLLSLVISHLNHLEIALLSWMNGIADKEIIEHQFKYLVCFNEGFYVLENLREVMGGKATYPAIDSFVAYLKSQNEKIQAQSQREIA